jgi:hypothetical protein
LNSVQNRRLKIKAEDSTFLYLSYVYQAKPKEEFIFGGMITQLEQLFRIKDFRRKIKQDSIFSTDKNSV